MPYQLKIELKEIHTPVWRRVVVPHLLTLSGLHQVIQQAMGWENKHLYEFEIDGKRYGPDSNDPEVFLIRDAFSDKTKPIRYVYDFGDYWEHEIKFEEPVFRLAETLVVDGEGDCPPEDIGGPPAYLEWCLKKKKKK
jgi:hypothetical protein